jgi:hypothetical protein
MCSKRQWPSRELLYMEVFTWLIRNFQTPKSLNIREREYRCLCSYYVINTYASLMCELKKLKRYLRVNLLGTVPSSYKKRIYRAAVSQRLRNTDLNDMRIKLKFLPHGENQTAPNTNTNGLTLLEKIRILYGNHTEHRSGTTVSGQNVGLQWVGKMWDCSEGEQCGTTVSGQNVGPQWVDKMWDYSECVKCWTAMSGQNVGLQ